MSPVLCEFSISLTAKARRRSGEFQGRRCLQHALSSRSAGVKKQVSLPLSVLSLIQLKTRWHHSKLLSSSWEVPYTECADVLCWVQQQQADSHRLLPAALLCLVRRNKMVPSSRDIKGWSSHPLFQGTWMWGREEAVEPAGSVGGMAMVQGGQMSSIGLLQGEPGEHTFLWSVLGRLLWRLATRGKEQTSRDGIVRLSCPMFCK